MTLFARRNAIVGAGDCPLLRQIRAEAMRSRPQPKNPLDLLLHTALDAVVVMQSDGTIVEWNERAAELFGWTRAEVVGRAMAELIIPERYRQAHFAGLKRFLEAGEGKFLDRRLELSALHRSGREFPVELRIWPAAPLLSAACATSRCAARSNRNCRRPNSNSRPWCRRSPTARSTCSIR